MNISEGTLNALKEHRASYQAPGQRPRAHPYTFWMNQAAIELNVQNLPGLDSAWNQVVSHLVQNHEWAK